MTPKPVRVNITKTLHQTEQLQRLRERFAGRSKDGKARMLDAFCEQHGWSRKHAIKLLGDTLPQPKGQSPPGPELKYLARARSAGPCLGTRQRTLRPSGRPEGLPCPALPANRQRPGTRNHQQPHDLVLTVPVPGFHHCHIPKGVSHMESDRNL